MYFSADSLHSTIHENRVLGNKIEKHFNTTEELKDYLITVLGFDSTWFYFVKDSFRSTDIALRLGALSSTYSIKHPNPSKNVYYGFIEIEHTLKKDSDSPLGYSPSGFNVILSLDEDSIYKYCEDVKRYSIKILPITIESIYGVDFKIFLLSHMPVEVLTVFSKNLKYDTIEDSLFSYVDKSTLLKLSPLCLEEYICNSFPNGKFIIKKDI